MNGLPEKTARVLRRLEEEHEDRRRRRKAGEGLLPLYCIPRDSAVLLHLLVRNAGARRALEVGTSSGYSGVWIATALAGGGELVTIEAEPAKVAMAERTFRDAGVADRVRIVEGRALDVLGGIDGPFDVAFLDAVKEEYVDYLESVAPKLRRGGLVVADNVVTHPDDLAAYVNRMQDGGDFVSVTVPIGNGFEVSTKL